MNICPKCSEVYTDDGISVCINCGHLMSDEDNIDHKNYPWVVVYTTSTELEAEMFRHNLESAGIPVNILSQIDTTRHFTIGGLAIVKIYVPSPLHSMAKEIIDSIEKDKDSDVL